MEVYENNNFLICYNTFDEIEAKFFEKIINYIIYYPIDWYNFLENILKNRLMISYGNTALIVSLEIITPQLKNSFNRIYDCMQSSGVVLNVIETKGFLIIYVYSKIISDFFQNSGYWLEYVTYYASLELGLCSYRGALLKTTDGKIQEVDVIIEYNSNLFLIECKDTHTYSNDDLVKLNNLRKIINSNSFGVFVCSKKAPNVDFLKHEIELIKYKFDYLEFRNNLKDYISRKLISLN